jgi:outer membrane protein OmpA-like peptidoglycan-associated protein
LALIVLSASGREAASGSDDRRYDICFDYGRTTPNASGIEVTEQVIKDAKERMSERGYVIIGVMGHASRGELDVSILSRRRAEAIRDMVRDAGISRESFALAWHGDKDPVSMLSSEEWRNRCALILVQ